jgi:hypothetical protein
VAGIAGQVSQQLQAAGFTVAAPANTTSTERSQIIDYGQHAQTREQFTGIVGNIPIVKRPAAEAPSGVDVVLLLGADYAEYIQR